MQHAFQYGDKPHDRMTAADTPADRVRLADPLLRLVFAGPAGGHERRYERVHRGPGLIGHLAGRPSRRHDQLAALGLVPAEPPVPAGGRREPHRPLRLAGHERTTHGGTDVVVLGLDRGEPFQLLGAEKMWIRGFSEFGEVREVRVARQVRFARLGEPLAGVLLDRTEHPVSAAPCRPW